uniref:Uncharacterized protein n=1 Tax=Glossina palpalis gambiensis TaxID=67801 RepID=A0A1B0AN58_9MUSC
MSIPADDNTRMEISRPLSHVHMILLGPHVKCVRTHTYVIHCVYVKSLNIFGSSPYLHCNSTVPEY